MFGVRGWSMSEKILDERLSKKEDSRMLHSTLPRAFLAPGINYLGYYGDEVHHPYAASTTWHIPMEESSSTYTRIPEYHALQSWDASRSSTPCPLDLSLKPPATPTRPRTAESIEVDDEKDHRARSVSSDQGQQSLENRRYGRDSKDASLLESPDFELHPRSSSAHSHSSFDQLSGKEPLRLQETIEKTRLPEESTRLSPYSANEIAQKYSHTQNQKLVLTSPNHLQSVPNYHPQILLTPQHHLQGIHAPMTPPSTPSPPQCPRRRPREDDGNLSTISTITGSSTLATTTPSPKQTVGSCDKSLQRPKKKHARRLKFDEDTSSPVSGTVILGPDEAVVTGDIDPAFNIVEVTEEARAELAKIENRLGPYQCKLCRQLHDDAFQLAQHRCSRIAHVEYRCPECDKRFSCPANLASHRRWHKPRLPNGENSVSGTNTEIPCTRCEAKFTRQAALRKHLASQHPETNNNNNTTSNNNNNSSTGVAVSTAAAAVAIAVGETQEAIGKTDISQQSADAPLSTEMP